MQHCNGNIIDRVSLVSTYSGEYRSRAEQRTTHSTLHSALCTTQEQHSTYGFNTRVEKKQKNDLVTAIPSSSLSSIDSGKSTDESATSGSI